MSIDKNESVDDKQLSSIYSHTSQDLPSQQLDDAILSAEKHATASHSLGPFSSNWRIPASLAAVLVISVGLVTFVEDDLETIEDAPPSFIENNLIASTSQFAKSIESKKELKRSKSPLKQAVASLSAESPTVPNPTKMKQEISKDIIAKQRQRSQSTTQFSLRAKTPPAISLNEVKTLRLTGDTNTANHAIDVFIKQNFGDDLDNIDLEKVQLSNAEWKELISELRKLAREDVADKLEKHLMQRLTN